jgi:hypothetical protein
VSDDAGGRDPHVRNDDPTPDELEGGPLAYALIDYMRRGEPVPPELARRFALSVRALVNADTDAVGFAEALGLAWRSAERARVFRDERRRTVRDVVLRYQALGLVLSDPSRREGTAFHAAATELEMSVATLYDIYRGKR